MARLLAVALVLVAVSSAGAEPNPQAPDGASRAEQARELTALGWHAQAEQRYAEARSTFERSIRLVPDQPQAQLGLAEALFWLGQHEAALAHYERVAARWPQLAHAYNGIGHACLNLAAAHTLHPRSHAGLLDRAARAFAQALALEPGHRAARDGLRLVAELRAPRGHSLRPLEWFVSTVLVLLAAVAARRVFRALRARTLPSLRELSWPLSLFAATRAVLFVSFAIAPALLAEAPRHPLPVLSHPSSGALDVVAGRWDANLYSRVALGGYDVSVPGSAAFSGVGQFPLLPILLRWTAYAVDDMHLAALLVPNVALLAATLVLFFWAKRQHGHSLACATTLALLVHPGSLYGSVLYAESLLLLGMLCAISRAERGAFVSAGLWAAFAGLARLNALAIVPWLLLEWWRQRREQPRACALAAFGPVISLAAYMLYLHVQFGDWLAYFHEMRAVRLGLGGFSTALVDTQHLFSYLFNKLVSRPARAPYAGPPPLLLLAIVCIGVYAASALALLRRRAWGPALFVIAGLALALNSTLGAQPRYLWVLFPTLSWLGSACNRNGLRYLVPILSLTCLVGMAIAYARWYFVT